MAGEIGAPAHLCKQRLPFMPRQPAAFEIGPGPFSPMVKEADVVVLPFERFYFALDEFVQFSKIGLDLRWDLKVQRDSPVRD